MVSKDFEPHGVGDVDSKTPASERHHRSSFRTKLAGARAYARGRGRVREREAAIAVEPPGGLDVYSIGGMEDARRIGVLHRLGSGISNGSIFTLYHSFAGFPIIL